MKAEAAIATGNDAAEVIDLLIARLPVLQEGAEIDLAFLFTSDAYADDLPRLLPEVKERTGARVLLGCSGQGLIGPGQEEEQEPAMSLQVMPLPGADLTPVRIDAAEAASPDAPDLIRERLGAAVFDMNALFLFVDPFSVDGERLLESVSIIDEDLPVVGGLASSKFSRRGTYVLLNDEVYEEGAVGVALGGNYEVKTVVSQGAAPLGEAWTITGVEGNLIQSIGMRPALEVLSDVFQSLTPEVQARARANLLVGLAMNEYRDEFRRGDFLIRNLVGVDRATGAVAIGAMPREGQTVQFQLRDPAAADEDLREMLGKARQELEGREIAGALLCSCNGRGIGLFGQPDHDAKAFMDEIGPVPVSGFFCNGEIGPVGGKNFLHGFTASIALILPRE